MASERLRRLQGHVATAATAPGPAARVELWTKAGADGVSLGDCPFSHGVAIALRLKEVEFAYRPVTVATKPPWLLDAGGGMPTLRCGDEVVTDSAAIVAFIDRSFGGDGPQLCTPCSDTAMEELAGVMTAIAVCIRAGATEAGGAKAALTSELHRVERLLAASGGPWLGGCTPCAADCSLLPKLLHMDVAARHYTHYTLPTSELPLLTGYMRAGLEALPAAVADYAAEEILYGWAQEGAVSPARLFSTQFSRQLSSLRPGYLSRNAAIFTGCHSTGLVWSRASSVH
jgi:glutathione S-transferase